MLGSVVLRGRPSIRAVVETTTKPWQPRSGSCTSRPNQVVRQELIDRPSARSVEDVHDVFAVRRAHVRLLEDCMPSAFDRQRILDSPVSQLEASWDDMMPVLFGQAVGRPGQNRVAAARTVSGERVEHHVTRGRRLRGTDASCGARRGHQARRERAARRVGERTWFSIVDRFVEHDGSSRLGVLSSSLDRQIDRFGWVSTKTRSTRIDRCGTSTLPTVMFTSRSRLPLEVELRRGNSKSSLAARCPGNDTSPSWRRPPNGRPCSDRRPWLAGLERGEQATSRSPLQLHQLESSL